MLLAWSGGMGPVTSFSGEVPLTKSGGNWVGSGVDHQSRPFSVTISLPTLQGTSLIDIVIEGLPSGYGHWMGTGTFDPLTRPWYPTDTDIHSEDTLFDGIWQLTFDHPTAPGVSDHLRSVDDDTDLLIDATWASDTNHELEDLVFSLTTTGNDVVENWWHDEITEKIHIAFQTGSGTSGITHAKLRVTDPRGPTTRFSSTSIRSRPSGSPSIQRAGVTTTHGRRLSNRCGGRSITAG